MSRGKKIITSVQTFLRIHLLFLHDRRLSQLLENRDLFLNPVLISSNVRLPVCLERMKKGRIQRSLFSGKTEYEIENNEWTNQVSGTTELEQSSTVVIEGEPTKDCNGFKDITGTSSADSLQHCRIGLLIEKLKQNSIDVTWFPIVDMKTLNILDASEVEVLRSELTKFLKLVANEPIHESILNYIDFLLYGEYHAPVTEERDVGSSQDVVIHASIQEKKLKLARYRAKLKAVYSL